MSRATPSDGAYGAGGVNRYGTKRFAEANDVSVAQVLKWIRSGALHRPPYDRTGVAAVTRTSDGPRAMYLIRSDAEIDPSRTSLVEVAS